MSVNVNIGLSGDWRKAAMILSVAPVKIRLALDRAVMQEAQFFRTKVVEGFRTQSPGGKPFKPLSETTLAFRRFGGFTGTKALILRGDLRNSIKVVKKSTALGAEAFVGVHKNARSRDGKSLVNIAEVHEFGSRPIVIEVTDAMRKFLMAQFSRMGEEEATTEEFSGGGIARGVIITQIPPRPFLTPVIEAHFDSVESAARFQARVAANLQGMMGIWTNVASVKRTSKSKSLFSTVAQAIKRAKGGPSRDPSTGRFMKNS
jgi:hypothetical protein